MATTRKKVDRTTRRSLEPQLAASMLYYDQEQFHAFLELFQEIEGDPELAPVGPFLTFIKYMTKIFKNSAKHGTELSNIEILNQLKQINETEPNEISREQFELWLEGILLEDNDILFELGEDLFYHYYWLCHKDKISSLDKSELPFKDKLNYKPRNIEFEEKKKILSLDDIILPEEFDGVYYTTGIIDLDEYLQPKNKNFMVAAARPGVGKSIFMLQMALQNAKNGIKSLFVSMEMSDIQIKTRIMKWFGGEDTEIDNWPHIQQSVEYKQVMKNLGIAIFGGRSANAVLDDIELSVQEQGYQIVMLDYLQITRYGDMDEWGSLRKLTFELKQLANKNDILVVSCSQVSRESTNYGLDLTSLFGSSTIENDTDIVLGFEDVETENIDDSPEASIDVKILKNRDGISRKTISQTLNRATMKYKSK